jgi:hypothetical protein
MGKTVKEQAHIIEFAEAVKRPDLMLNTEAKGYSLEPFYEKVPDILRGYVELQRRFKADGGVEELYRRV